MSFKAIPLTQGQSALVDDGDFLSVSRYKWSARWSKDSQSFYAIRNSVDADGNRVTVQMHRSIMSVADRLTHVDHKNHNGLDNRRENLRICDAARNGANSVKRAPASSKFKGVCWHKASERWIAQIGLRGKRTHLGSFTVETDAARKYDRAAREAFGEFANLNFPGE